MNDVVALVLAGGRGTRMGVLCHTRPKPTLSYGAIHRVADFTLSNCVNSGILDVAALIDHQRSEMARYLKKWQSATRRLQTLARLAPRTACYDGTADAVYQNLDYVEGHDGSSVLILAGDHVYNMDYGRILDFHRRAGADATVAVVRVPISQAHRFGTILTDRQGRITDFIEKSSRPTSNLASMGIYVFDKRSLVRCVREDANDPRSPHDFGYAILPELLGRGRVYALEFSDYWQDVGTVEAYYESQMDLAGEQPKFALSSEWPVFGELNKWDSASHNRSNIVHSVVGPGCVVEGYVENSILSPGVRVAKQAEVRNSVVMAKSSIGRGSTVKSCVLDENVRIGELCDIGLRDIHSSGSCNITVLGCNVIVPDHTVIGGRCSIAPHSGPDSFWSDSIPSGTVMQNPA